MNSVVKTCLIKILKNSNEILKNRIIKKNQISMTFYLQLIYYQVNTLSFMRSLKSIKVTLNPFGS